jgi:hypothetical protein
MFRSKIISSENYFKTRELRWALSFIFASGFILMPFRNRKGLLEILDLSELLMPFEIIWLLSTVLLVILYFYSRKTKHIGQLICDSQSISFNLDKKVTNFSISQISDIIITHNSFMGEDIKSNPLNNFKGNNYIQFNFEGKPYKVEFEVDSHYLNSQLVKLIDIWKEEQIQFRYDIV